MFKHVQIAPLEKTPEVNISFYNIPFKAESYNLIQRNNLVK